MQDRELEEYTAQVIEDFNREMELVKMNFEMRVRRMASLLRVQKEESELKPIGRKK